LGVRAFCLIPSGLPDEREAILEGLANSGYKVLDHVPDSISPYDVAVMWNRWNQNDRLAERVESRGGRVIVAENGYLGRGNVALALSQHNGGGVWQSGDRSRLERLNVDFKPWRTDGNHILVCPSRGMGSMLMRQPSNWLDFTVNELRQSGREVRVRKHPGNWKQDPPKVPLEEDLAGAWACVIWNSSAGVHALIHGIPVVCAAPRWICKDIASGSIDALVTPDRMEAFIRLAWAQWSLDEIKTGEPFNRLREC
jgi:hypothetical protein